MLGDQDLVLNPGEAAEFGTQVPHWFGSAGGGPLGPPLRGVWYETTAIAEIRAQAAGLASHLTAVIRGRQRPGSAA